MCLSGFVRRASSLAKDRVNPLLGEFTGLNFKVTAEDVKEAIPALLKSSEEEFNKFEQNLSGIIAMF